ncbi:MAG: hypothetical protein JNG89_18790 [Planctomycetaceae bacterium]|nr:hypothetical protein [Planctomycetaceae bacterium]
MPDTPATDDVRLCGLQPGARGRSGSPPTVIGGASILSSTTRADGTVIVPAELEGYGAGTDVDVLICDASLEFSLQAASNASAAGRSLTQAKAWTPTDQAVLSPASDPVSRAFSRWIAS